MASSPKPVCLFLLLTTLVFSLQTHARDSQFFSKVTRNHDTTTNPSNNFHYNNNNNENNEFVHLNKQEEQEEKEPTFLPQTTGSGYGLYGHETGLDPPTTTTSLYNLDGNTYENHNNMYKKFNNEHNDREKNYVPQLSGLSETSYTNVDPTKYDEGAGYNGGVEKQGMSDTRFLEHGQYYYDIHHGKYGPNHHYRSYTNNYKNNYNNNNEYFGNNKETTFEEYYSNKKNNNNYNYNANGMQQEYRNQVPEEEEFDFDQP